MASINRKTSLTVGYQSEHWGIERIVLDSLTNHLPSDSKGSTFSINFLNRSGKWVSYERRHEISPDKVQAVKFEDDGIGYPDIVLELLYSDKKEDKESIGEKGEGLKMAIKACIENGIDVEVRSTLAKNGDGLRTWKGVPFTEDVAIRDRVAKRVCFRVDDLPAEERPGSVTLFRNPSPKFVEYIQNTLEERVLLLRPHRPQLFQGDSGAILDESGSLFVKGIYITDMLKDQLCFGYNLKAVSPNRDRNNVNLDEVKFGLRRILDELTDKDLIKRLIKRGENGPAIEFDVLSYDYEKKTDPVTGQERIVKLTESSFELIKPYELWKEAFYELYGKKSVVGSTRDSVAKLNGYTVAKLSDPLETFLFWSGVERSCDLHFADSDILLRDENSTDYNRLTIETKPTSFTLHSGRTGWGSLRIALDTISNHVDSEGKFIQIEYLINRRKLEDDKDSFEWVAQEGISNGHVYGIRVKDDGKGFDIEKLPLLYSDKVHEESDGSRPTGGFGEGMKMVSLAVLREQKHDEGAKNMRIKYRTRGAAATPVLEEIEIDSKKTEKVHFLVAKNLDEIVGSATIIYEPSPLVVDTFRRIQLYVLKFNEDYEPLHSGEEGSLFDPKTYSLLNTWEKNHIFVNGFYITSSYNDNLIFNYNLNVNISDVSPDRDNVDIGIVRNSVGELIRSCKSKVILERVIKIAQEEQTGSYFEFVEVDFETEDGRAEIWKSSFTDLYGNKAVLWTDDGAAREAQHLNYVPISVNPKVRKTLHNAGVLTDLEVICEGLEPSLVDENMLTDEERKVYSLMPAIEGAIFALEDDRPELPQVKIFSEVQTKDGEVRADTLGYYKKSDNTIYIRRNCLRDPKQFILTYTHERGHQVTGGRDADDIFRDFFEELGYFYISSEVQGENALSEKIAEVREKLERARAKYDTEHTEFVAYKKQSEDERAKSQRESEAERQGFDMRYKDLQKDHDAFRKNASAEIGSIEQARDDLESNLRQIAYQFSRFVKPKDRPDIDRLDTVGVVDYLTKNLGSAKLLFKRRK